MRLQTAFVFAFFLVFTGYAHAQNVPDAALAKDYQNCMGDETATSDPQRAQYCGCVMNEMKKWDEKTYASVASAQAQAGNIPAPQIEAMAKSCIDKILK